MIPGHEQPWMRAFEGMLEARSIINRLNEAAHKSSNNARLLREHGFLVDGALLANCIPFAWSGETADAVLQAGHSIPGDTMFTRWNFDAPAVWWWFEKPLPFATLTREVTLEDNETHGRGGVTKDGYIIPYGELLSGIGVRALTFGWLDRTINKDGVKTNYPVLGCSAWCDEDFDNYGYRITPSQTWVWLPEWNLEKMLEQARTHYKSAYEAGGKWSHVRTIGVEPFMKATEGLSRFILAGLAWLRQTVLTTTEGHVERHRRKELVRKGGPNVSAVQVISLRRMERVKTAVEIEQSEHSVNWQHRWVVSGHFRNQVCGAGRGDRRLTWIEPFVKGPDDKPLLPSRQKIYRVDR